MQARFSYISDDEFCVFSYNTDYIGVDCSINVKDPPVLYSAMFGDVCDVRNRTCNRVTLFASGFLISSNLTCRFVSVTIQHLIETLFKIWEKCSCSSWFNFVCSYAS